MNDNNKENITSAEALVNRVGEIVSLMNDMDMTPEECATVFVGLWGFVADDDECHKLINSPKFSLAKDPDFREMLPAIVDAMFTITHNSDSDITEKDKEILDRLEEWLPIGMSKEDGVKLETLEIGTDFLFFGKENGTDTTLTEGTILSIEKREGRVLCATGKGEFHAPIGVIVWKKS